MTNKYIDTEWAAMHKRIRDQRGHPTLVFYDRDKQAWRGLDASSRNSQRVYDEAPDVIAGVYTRNGGGNMWADMLAVAEEIGLVAESGAQA